MGQKKVGVATATPFSLFHVVFLHSKKSKPSTPQSAAEEEEKEEHGEEG
jgi:hypothetical protein